MKCTILHEGKGRMRVHVENVRMTLHRADVLEAYLNHKDAIVHPPCRTALPCATGYGLQADTDRCRTCKDIHLSGNSGFFLARGAFLCLPFSQTQIPASDVFLHCW